MNNKTELIQLDDDHDDDDDDDEDDDDYDDDDDDDSNVDMRQCKLRLLEQCRWMEKSYHCQ